MLLSMAKAANGECLWLQVQQTRCMTKNETSWNRTWKVSKRWRICFSLSFCFAVFFTLLFTNNIFCLLIPAMTIWRAPDFWSPKATMTTILASTAPNVHIAAAAIVMMRLAVSTEIIPFATGEFAETWKKFSNASVKFKAWKLARKLRKKLDSTEIYLISFFFISCVNLQVWEKFNSLFFFAASFSCSVLVSFLSRSDVLTSACSDWVSILINLR